MLGLSMLLLTGVLIWKDCLSEQSAWDTLSWFAVLVGSFLEGGTKEEYEAITKDTRLKSAIEDIPELERQGLGFALAVSQQPPPPSQPREAIGFGIIMDISIYTFHAIAGVLLAASITAFSYWYRRKCRRW